MCSERYVNQLDDYSGPIDRASPYHIYQHLYWTLRGKWRRELYAWTRREPTDAQAQISPEQTMASKFVTLTLEVNIGPTPIETGGRIAVYFPLHFGGFANACVLRYFQGPDGQRGYGARISAASSQPDVALGVQVHSTGSVFTCVEVIVDTGRLVESDRVRILIGDPACKPPIVSEHAKSFPFRIAVDHAGDGTWRPIVPNPVVSNVGDRAYYLRCFAPPTPPVGDLFSVRVVAADLGGHNPSCFHQGQLDIEDYAGQLAAPIKADFPLAAHGSVLVPGAMLHKQGVTRLQVVDKANGLMGRTNPLCPEAAPLGYSLYYGEIHSHTELSDGGGTPEDSYRWARDVEGLDFSALADHFEDGQSYNYTLENKWRITQAVTERFNEPGRFVTLLGYEIGTLEQHRNVYFADGEGRMIVQGTSGEPVTMDNVFAKLAGTDYILIPHAPKFHGINWRRPHDPERQRLVEICSYWGISEEGGPLSVRAALDLGYKFGFTGGTDNHQAEPGNPDIGGITGVYASGLSRREIFEALRARRAFATNGARMILTFSVDDTFMGSETMTRRGQPRQVRGRAITADPIQVIEIIRNGEVVHTVHGDERDDIALEWEDTEDLSALTPKRELTSERFVYYYLRMQTITGSFGWASPVWVHTDKQS
jgi:hypothetical protein